VVGKRKLLLPLAFALGLAGVAFLSPIRQNPNALWSFLGASAVLCAWNALLFAWTLSGQRTLILEVVLKKQHYLQA